MSDDPRTDRKFLIAVYGLALEMRRQSRRLDLEFHNMRFRNGTTITIDEDEIKVAVRGVPVVVGVDALERRIGELEQQLADEA